MNFIETLKKFFNTKNATSEKKVAASSDNKQSCACCGHDDSAHSQPEVK